MKVVIYQPKPREEKEEVLRLRLIPSVSRPGGVTLAAVNEEGEKMPYGAAIIVLPDGSFKRVGDLNPLFQKDHEGKIRETF